MPTSSAGELVGEARAQRARPRRSAAPAASGGRAGAPKTHSAASPSNLLTQPPCSSTTSTTTPKNSLSSSTTSCGGRVAASSVEPTRSTNSTATSRVLAAELDAALERRAGDVLADLAAEQVAQLARARAGRDHAVEAGLQQPDLAAVVDRRPRRRCRPRCTSPIARRSCSSGSASERAESTVASSPTTSAMPPSEEHDDGEPVARRVQQPRELAERGERQAEHGDAGPERPEDQDPRRHAGDDGPLRQPHGQRARVIGRRIRSASR